MQIYFLSLDVEDLALARSSSFALVKELMDFDGIHYMNRGIEEYSRRATSLAASAARFAVLSTLITIGLGFTSAALVVLSSVNLTLAKEVAAAILAVQLINAFLVAVKVAIDPSKKATMFQQCAKEYNDIKRDLIVTRDEWRMSGESEAVINQRYIELARELNKKEDKIYADQPLQIFADRTEVNISPR